MVSSKRSSKAAERVVDEEEEEEAGVSWTVGPLDGDDMLVIWRMC